MSESLLRLAETATLSAAFFILIVAATRVLGKRTTAHMNNFDWIVTVTMGSLASSGILLETVSVFDAALAIVILGSMQWATAWAAVRWTWFARLVKSRPRMLTHKGVYLDDALAKERITRQEVDAALRKQGMYELEDSNWVIVETNGELTVLPRRRVHVDSAGLLNGVDRDEGSLASTSV